MLLNAEELKNYISKGNKAWVTRQVKKQEGYGDFEAISVRIEVLNDGGREIEFQFGESWGVFIKRKYGSNKGKWERSYGNLYHEKEITKIVNELAESIGWGGEEQDEYDL